MKKERVIFILVSILVICIAVFGYYTYLNSSQKSSIIGADQVLIKAVLKQGDNLTKTLTISNLGGNNTFDVSEININNFSSLNATEIQIEKGNSAIIQINFYTINLQPDVYIGSILIKNGNDQRSIPVVLEVQTQQSDFAVTLDVNSNYKQIEIGKETLTNVNFVNLIDTNQHNIQADYKIISSNGKIVNSKSEITQVTTRSTVAENMVIPVGTSPGDYIFAVTLKYGGTVGTASYLLQAVQQGTLNSVNISNLFSIIVIIILVMIVIMIIYIIHERDKIFSELEEKHNSEIKFYSKGIELKKKEALTKAKTDTEKEKILREFEDAKKKIINGMIEERNNQRKEFNLLKKQKDKLVLNKKIHDWKKTIYPKVIKNTEISADLKGKLNVLRHAYEEGYITEGSYKKGKRRIDNKIRRKSL